MIKFIAAALWLVGVTIGTMMFAFSANGPEPETPEGTMKLEGIDYLKSEMISVPVIRGGDVQGYFLTRLVVAADSEKLKKLALPVDVVLVDEIYTYLFSNPAIDFSNTDRLDVETMRNGLKDSVNARVGQTLLHDVLVQQIDYLSKTQIRDNAIRRRGAAGGDNRPVLR